MKIKRIKPISLAKLQGIVMLVFGLLVGIIGAVTALTTGENQAAAAVVIVVALPVFYGVIGFIGGLISASVYNLVAGRVGGIEIETE